MEAKWALNAPGEIRMADGERVATGNAGDSRFARSRGWFVSGLWGAEAGLRQSDDVEVKWCEHVSGESRRQISVLESATSLAILISGSFMFDFPGESPSKITLSAQGDYVLYAPGVAHGWEALQDSVVLTIRWPAGSKYHEFSYA